MLALQSIEIAIGGKSATASEIALTKNHWLIVNYNLVGLGGNRRSPACGWVFVRTICFPPTFIGRRKKRNTFGEGEFNA